ncbi:MAG: hypothetical protein NZM31_01890 [Gemmatales bacterium]|nr:hypothetical protein [Gemmatales bacterium]MDW8385748.1 hypothetical protein [Gemmatales bacterium]
MSERDYTPYQLKVIERYYRNQPTLLRQRLADLVGELFLADDKKKARLWKRVEAILRTLQVPESRIVHLLQRQDPQLLAGLVKELESGDVGKQQRPRSG